MWVRVNFKLFKLWQTFHDLNVLRKFTLPRRQCNVLLICVCIYFVLNNQTLISHMYTMYPNQKSEAINCLSVQ